MLKGMLLGVMMMVSTTGMEESEIIHDYQERVTAIYYADALVEMGLNGGTVTYVTNEEGKVVAVDYHREIFEEL